MNVLANILISAIVGALATIGAYNFMPLSFIEKFGPEAEPRFGAVITTIAATDTLRDSRTTINNNFTALNNYKVENASSSIAAITTLSNLTSIGTTTTGGWNASVIGVIYGGTATTTLPSNLILLGNGTGAIRVVNGTGASGQFLQSQGASSPPIWVTSAVDQAAAYNWTGLHTFDAGVINRSASSTVTDNINFSGRTASTTFAGTVNFGGQVFGSVAASSSPVAKLAHAEIDSATATITVSNLPARSSYRIIAYTPSFAASGRMHFYLNSDFNENYGCINTFSDGTSNSTADANQIALANAGTTNAAHAVINISNRSGSQKVMTITVTEAGAGAAAPTGVTKYCVWNNTTANVSTVTISGHTTAATANTNLGAGAFVEIYAPGQ